jgi:iron complex outermembrane receptor protein
MQSYKGRIINGIAKRSSAVSRSGLLAATGVALAIGALPALAQQSDEGTIQREVLLPIEVWGDRNANDPGSYSALDAADIAATAADHPAEILNHLPGVNVQMNSGQEHLIAIRSPVLTGGAGQGSFLILENGVPTRSPAFGNVNSLIEPHHEVADAIEVVRGPGSAKYGSNAVHGLINVILPEPGEGSEFRASYGTLGRWRTDMKLDEGQHWLFNLSLQKDTGWRDNTDVSQQKISVVGKFNPGVWDAIVWLSGQNLEQESGGYIVGANAYKDEDIAKTNPDPDAYRNAWSARLGARLERPLFDGKLDTDPLRALAGDDLLPALPAEWRRGKERPHGRRRHGALRAARVRTAHLARRHRPRRRHRLPARNPAGPVRLLPRRLPLPAGRPL